MRFLLEKYLMFETTRDKKTKLDHVVELYRNINHETRTAVALSLKIMIIQDFLVQPESLVLRLPYH